MTKSFRERLLLAAVVSLAAYFSATSYLPYDGILGLVRRILGHPVFLLGSGGAVAAVYYLARRGRRKLAALIAVVGVLVVGRYAVRKMQVWFPGNVLFSPTGYLKAAKLLLGKDILLGDYQPQASVTVHNPGVTHARYKAIDVHFHLGSLDSTITPERLVAAMDSVGIESVVNLDGLPETFAHFSRDWADRYPGRFINFATPELWHANRPDFARYQTDALESAVERGARGIKIWKALGLEFRDTTSVLIPIDDPRFDFIWNLAEALGLPVLIHTADPAPFFRPIDRFNERYTELRAHRSWSFFGADFPPRDSLFAQRERLLRKHPRTVFIGAHVGSNEDDLAYAGSLLDRYPNYYVDISSRLNDLGRQPRSARQFFIRYQDRILFGTDGGFALGRANWSIEKFYARHFEFLETDAEYVDYPLAELTKQGSWKIYGLSLPDSVLAKVYAANARKLIPREADTRERLRTLRQARAQAVEPTDMACAGKEVRWARADASPLRSPASRPALGDDSVQTPVADFHGDSVKLLNYSFRPGQGTEIVASGLIGNRSRSMIELRGYRVEYLSPTGEILGTSSCRVRVGYEHCGLGGTNIRRPGYLALSADTLPPAPPRASLDTARIFWTYCERR